MFVKVGVFLVTLVCSAIANSTSNSLINEFSEGNHRLTAAVYRELLKSNTGNFLVSPFSLETILSLTQEGAQGDTGEEIRRGLQLPNSREKIEQFYREALPRIKGSDQYTLASANKVYVKDGFKISERFRTAAEQIFLAGVENINFTDPNEASKTINEWVQQQTNNKISDLIDPNGLNDLTRLVLINALYFKGKWINRFENHLTNKQPFYKTRSETQEVTTMHQTDLFNYYECTKLNAKFLELPYQGGDVSMVIVLPNDKFGLEALEKNIESVFEPRAYTKENVYVSLPAFTIESKIKFVPVLQNLGIKKAFTDEADLSGIGAGKEPLHISDVVQKTFINVTETGTEAAAATAVSVALLSISEPITPKVRFEADHPFVFYIKYNDFVLFFGRYTSP